MTPFDRRAPALYIPALAPLYRSIADYGYAFLRICTGAILIPHGVSKLTGGVDAALAAKLLSAAWWSTGWTTTLGVLELVGGLFLVLGLLTRPVALLLLIEFLVVLFGVSAANGWPWIRMGVQYPIMLSVLCVAMIARGGGFHSIDRRLAKEF